jgi:hypothetical protein
MPDLTISWPDLIGLIGVMFSIGCYARVQWQRDYAKRMSYSMLNFLASLLIGISLAYAWSLPSFVCNTIWGLISLYGIYRCARYMVREKNLKNKQQAAPKT